jgi:hypothetical protein
MSSQRVFDDLRSVLESFAYLKIAFDARLLYNCFKQFDLDVQQICDLQLTLSIDRKTEYGNIDECVTEIFGFNPEIESQVRNCI